MSNLLVKQAELIAKKVHELYNQKQLENNNQSFQHYPTWESLPEDIKNNSVRQAKNIRESLEKINCYVAEHSDDIQVTLFSRDEIEFIAKTEHELWMSEKLQNNWKFGEKKDIDAKESPCLVPYEKLPEEIKDCDRAAAKNIIPLLNSAGIKIYKHNKI